MFKKILVPVDGTEYSANAMQYAKSLATMYNSDIYLIHVIKEKKIVFIHLE